MFKKLSIKPLLADRAYLASLLVMVLVVLLVVIAAAVYIRPGELKVPVRYSFFDSRKYALEQWYYLLNFVFFAILTLALHTLVSAKLYHTKGRQFALGFAALGIAVLSIGSVFFLSIFKVVSLSQ